MRRFLVLVLLAAGMAVVPVGTASAGSHLSPGCAELNDSRFDGYYTSMSGSPFIQFNPGEQIRITAGPPHTVTHGAGLQLWVSPGGHFIISSFPGTVTFLIPDSPFPYFGVMWQVRHFIGIPAQATFDVSCGDPDTDGDGVLDADDQCPGTTVDAIPAEDLGSQRYAWYGGEYFVSGSDKAPMFSMADTGGCSATQIITELHLGEGHSKHGVSLGPLSNWTSA